MSLNFNDKSKEKLLPQLYSTINYTDDASFLDRNKDLWDDVKLFIVNAYEMGRSDPRQFIFAAKTGLALAIVSILIFYKEPSNWVSQYSLWALLTVIVVFEFSIGKIECS